MHWVVTPMIMLPYIRFYLKIPLAVFPIVEGQFGEVHVAKNGEQLLRIAKQQLGAERGL